MCLFIRNNRWFILLAVLSILQSGNVAAKKINKNKTVVATIVNYECADNCYLTVTDAKGQQRTGLCVAPLCDSWNAEASMPENFKGKKVRFVLGKGQQLDGGGNLMGTTDAFLQIEVLN